MNAPRSPYRRGDWYKAFKLDADCENIFSETDEERHHEMRRKRASAYSGKENPKLELSIDEIICSMINLIETKYVSDENIRVKLDFARLANFYTLDVITSLSLSKPLGYLENDEDIYEYLKTMEDNFPVITFVSAVPVLSRIMRMHWFQKLAMPSVKDKAGLGRIKGIAKDIISRRFGSEKAVFQDMIGSFVRHGLTLEETADESLLQILAGSDTSATTIRMAMLHIISIPQVYTRLVNELTKTRGLPGLSSIITDTQAQRLPYLNACVKESLRHTPPATGIFPKIVAPEGDNLPDGTYLPPGTEVSTCVIGVHYNSAIYGLDADVFRPERWLEATPEQLVLMDRTHELIFGYGRFKCLGERVARMETLKGIAELIRRYEWRLCYPEHPMEKSVNLGLFIQKGMWVYVEKRKTQK